MKEWNDLHEGWGEFLVELKRILEIKGPVEEINRNTPLTMDSLGVVEVITSIEERWNKTLTFEEVRALKTVDELHTRIFF